MRSSLQTDELSVPSNHTSSKCGPPASCTDARIPIVSMPAPGTFLDVCGSQGPSRIVPPDCFPMRIKRKPTEMPLSCHPPFRKSWLEVQPSQTYISRPKARLRADTGHSNPNAPSLEDDVRKTSPGAKTSRPYHGIVLPPPPPIPHTRQRSKSHSKPSVATFQDTTPINLFEQPIAPLTPRHLKSATLHPVRSPRSSGTSSKTQHNPAKSSNVKSYIAKPPTLRDHRVNRRSSHVVLADASLELKVFSELGDELAEVMGLYTGIETS